MYCGVDILVQDAIKAAAATIDPQHYMLLARESENGGDHDTANLYYLKVLEVDPSNVAAWQGIGTCSGWRSNLVVCRFRETINSYHKALELVSSEANRDSLKAEMAASALLIARAYFEMSLDHTVKFIAVREAQFEHADRIKNAIDLCEFAIALDPRLTEAKKFVADIADRASKIHYLGPNELRDFKTKVVQYASSVEKSRSGSGQANDGTSTYVYVGIFYVICFALVSSIFDIPNIVVRLLVTLFVPIPILIVAAWSYLIYQKLFK